MSDEAMVIDLLFKRFPFGLSPSEITKRAEFPHGQRTGGVLRKLGNLGVVERQAGHIFLDYAAAHALAIVREGWVSA